MEKGSFEAMNIGHCNNFDHFSWWSHWESENVLIKVFEEGEKQGEGEGRMGASETKRV